MLSQNEVFGAASGYSNTSIGLSQWCIDVHTQQRIAVPPNLTGRGWELGEAGNVNTCRHGLAWQLTEIPYSALIPMEDETTNMIVYKQL